MQIHPRNISKPSWHPTNYLNTCYWVLERCEHWVLFHDLYCPNDIVCHMPDAPCYQFIVNVHNCFAWDELMSCESYDGVLWFIKSYLCTPCARCHLVCNHSIRNQHCLDRRRDLDDIFILIIRMGWCVI